MAFLSFSAEAEALKICLHSSSSVCLSATIGIIIIITFINHNIPFNIVLSTVEDMTRYVQLFICICLSIHDITFY